MASRVELFDVLVPAGTLKTAPQVTSTAFDSGDVERIDVLVPPGPSGLVGFGILYSGESVIPREPSKWLVSNDEKLSWPVEAQPDTGAWGVRAYNTDVYPHTLYFRFLVREHQRGAPRPVTPITITQPEQEAVAPEDELAGAI